ncbi:hypothetical protein EC844_101267 [Acinetobacter calcoaceticus]|uniref:Uncharacterized protein n=1 Tax=Acinetobacter calcoaceticus TaxID=471 RepID=A0A4R1Y5M7_ACICA|nr:hypothetical protein EC844_101267 [Acinetobacter calcoaceticus]
MFAALFTVIGIGLGIIFIVVFIDQLIEDQNKRQTEAAEKLRQEKAEREHQQKNRETKAQLEIESRRLELEQQRLKAPSVKSSKPEALNISQIMLWILAIIVACLAYIFVAVII